ncbi:MAG: biopolymer transporter ExbD [Bacteroidota bacterium]
MGLKKRSSVSAEFSMSSLTDIIFLLLIFFMLTSSLVQINMDLPESDSKTVASTSIVVKIDKKNNHKLNEKPVKISQLESAIGKVVRESDNRENAALTIAAEKGVHWENISRLMTIARRLEIKAILATQAKK